MILEEILSKKKKRLKEEKALVPLDKLKNLIQEKNYRKRSFNKALDQKGISILGEIKRASPSKGLIKDDLDPLAVASEYEDNGVAIISVLTEEDYFFGKKEYLSQLRDFSKIPILRKDFIIDPYQIYESKALGADGILLIARILEREELIEFKDLAQALDLDILLEINTKEDIEKIKGLDFPIIGINNRNLKNFSVDLRTTEKLKEDLEEGTYIISESGVGTRKDMAYLKSLGIDGVLIGESLMRAKSIGARLEDLLAVNND